MANIVEQFALGLKGMTVAHLAVLAAQIKRQAGYLSEETKVLQEHAKDLRSQSRQLRVQLPPKWFPCLSPKNSARCESPGPVSEHRNVERVARMHECEPLLSPQDRDWMTLRLSV